MNNEVFNKLFQLLANSPYNQPVKDEAKKLGLKILRKIAKELKLKNYEIRYNPGGIAIEGDLCLHDEKFYLHLTPVCNQWFFHRSCKGLKDYHGGPNQAIYIQQMENQDISKLIDILRNAYYPVDI